MDPSETSPAPRARWRALRGPERLSLILSAVLAVGFPVGAAVDGWFGVGPLAAGLLFAGLTVWRWMSWTRSTAPSDDQVP